MFDEIVKVNDVATPLKRVRKTTQASDIPAVELQHRWRAQRAASAQGEARGKRWGGTQLQDKGRDDV